MYALHQQPIHDPILSFPSNLEDFFLDHGVKVAFRPLLSFSQVFALVEYAFLATINVDSARSEAPSSLLGNTTWPMRALPADELKVKRRFIILAGVTDPCIFGKLEVCQN